MGKTQGIKGTARRSRLLFLLSTFYFLLSSASAFAWAEGSVITWGSPTNISGDSDVATAGTLVAGFNMNGPAVTVNTVSFSSWTFTTNTTSTSNGNFTFTETSHILAASGLGAGNTPFAGLSANYQSLLNTALTTDENNTLTLTISGLIVGHQYQFQWWLNASQYNGTGFGFRTTATAPNSVSLDDNTTNAIGGTGQYVIGTFTCGDPTEIITFTGTDATQAPTVNAFQLRDLTVVPEPSTLALLGIGSVIVALRRRK